MRADAHALLELALTLPHDERAEIARSLLESLEPPLDADIEAAWTQEVASRVASLDAGEVETLPWGEVRERFFAAVRAGLTDSEAGRLIDDAELGATLNLGT